MNSVQSPTLQRLITAAGAACMALAFMIAADASAAPTGKSHQPTKQAKLSPAVTIAVQYAEAIAKGDRVAFAKLDFACLYRLVAVQPSSAKSPAAGGSNADSCWKDLADAHAPSLVREDIGMDVIWPSNGNLVFYREALDRYPASVFVMDALGLSPPGTGLHLDPAGTTAPAELQTCVTNLVSGLALAPPDKREGQATWIYEFSAAPAPAPAG